MCSVNDDGTGGASDALFGMMLNKVIELATEAIPACIFQIVVWLDNSEELGMSALVSIGISAMTTGFANAMIAFDCDVDVTRRKINNFFYGYIPDDHGHRGRCFTLMTMISACHNLSRSIACALLESS